MELAFHNKRYTISINELRGMGAGKGEFRPMKSDDIDNLIKVHGTSFSHNGAVKRDREMGRKDQQAWERWTLHRISVCPAVRVTLV